jgi:hypothetical protein
VPARRISTLPGRVPGARSFASQVVSAGTGFIWATTARLAGLPVSGFDRYISGATSLL